MNIHLKMTAALFCAAMTLPARAEIGPFWSLEAGGAAATANLGNTGAESDLGYGYHLGISSGLRGRWLFAGLGVRYLAVNPGFHQTVSLYTYGPTPGDPPVYLGEARGEVTISSSYFEIPLMLGVHGSLGSYLWQAEAHPSVGFALRAITHQKFILPGGEISSAGDYPWDPDREIGIGWGVSVVGARKFGALGLGVKLEAGQTGSYSDANEFDADFFQAWVFRVGLVALNGF